MSDLIERISETAPTTASSGSSSSSSSSSSALSHIHSSHGSHHPTYSYAHMLNSTHRSVGSISRYMSLLHTHGAIARQLLQQHYQTNMTASYIQSRSSFTSSPDESHGLSEEHHHQQEGGGESSSHHPSPFTSDSPFVMDLLTEHFNRLLIQLLQKLQVCSLMFCVCVCVCMCIV